MKVMIINIIGIKLVRFNEDFCGYDVTYVFFKNIDSSPGVPINFFPL